MKYINKVVALLAAIIGIMAVVTGSRVLLGLFDPGYNYFTALISYNIFMGMVSFVAGILIWRQNSKALLLSKIITIFHIIVLLLLVTVFREIISIQSIGAMAFRSVAWLIFTLILWKAFPKSELSKN
jgi:uncharacterized membrane protein